MWVRTRRFPTREHTRLSGVAMGLHPHVADREQALVFEPAVRHFGLSGQGSRKMLTPPPEHSVLPLSAEHRTVTERAGISGFSQKEPTGGVGPRCRGRGSGRICAGGGVAGLGFAQVRGNQPPRMPQEQRSPTDPYLRYPRFSVQSSHKLWERWCRPRQTWRCKLAPTFTAWRPSPPTVTWVPGSLSCSQRRR